MSAGIFAGRKGRARKEAVTAYLFLLPSILIIFVFGLWPVIHAAYVSMHKWNIKPKGSQCLPYWFASLGFGSPEALEQTDCLGLDHYVSLSGFQSVAAARLLPVHPIGSLDVPRSEFLSAAAVRIGLPEP